jgi:hypothetical protein
MKDRDLTYPESYVFGSVLQKGYQVFLCAVRFVQVVPLFEMKDGKPFPSSFSLCLKEPCKWLFGRVDVGVQIFLSNRGE